jgi:hypothetical protein
MGSLNKTIDMETTIEQKFETLHKQLADAGFIANVEDYEESLGVVRETRGRIVNREGRNIETLLSDLGMVKSTTKEKLYKDVYGTFVYWTSKEGFRIKYRDQSEHASNEWFLVNDN